MSAKIPPKPSKDVIYVDVDDEITSIIDKIENADHKVVALVLPKRAASLQSIVNMKLLKRSADTAGKNPVLITSEAALLPLAGAAGLHVAKNLQSKPEVPEAPVGAVAAQAADVPAEELPETDEPLDEDNLPGKIDYEHSIGALAAAHEVENPETIALDDEDEADKPAAKVAKTPKDKKNKVPNFDRFRMLLGLGILAFVGLIVFIILALFVLPKATITIQTSSEPLSANFNLAASAATTALDSKTGAIPAKLESSDQTGSQSVTATGSQNNGDKAAGTVTMTAKECAPNLGTPDDVSAGIGISSNGLNFITQAKTSFTFGSAAGSCVNYSATSSTPIKAVAAGSKYNLASGSTFSVRSDVSASGSSTGGTDNVVTILSQSDVDGATQKLTTGTTGSDFTKALEKKLSDAGEYVLGNTLKAGDPVITASPAVGQPASTSNVTIKINYTVLTIKKTDLSQAIQDKLSSQIDKTKQKLNGNFLNDASVTVQSQASPTTAALTINEDTTAVPIINIASVKKQAEGKKVGDIKAAIGNWAGVKSVDVKLSPFWVSKVPKKDGKVKVIIQEVKTSSSNSGQP
jgi:cytoskeletal protein RodZ